jgi:hypothetical protein
MANPFTNRLAAMNKEWQRREEPSKVTDGEYLMRLQSADLQESQSSGKLQIKRVHVIQDGEFRGETITDYMQLETEKGPFFVAKWIEQMGEEVPAQAQDLANIVAKISRAKPAYTAEIKSSKDFKNVRIKELVTIEGEAEAEPAAEEPAEESAEEAPAGKKASAAEAVDAPLFAAGDTVTFKEDDGTAHEGTFKSLNAEDAEYADIDVDGDVWTVPVEICEPVEAAPAEDPVEKAAKRVVKPPVKAAPAKTKPAPVKAPPAKAKPSPAKKPGRR